MDRLTKQTQRTTADFKDIWENSGFWSCFGFEGLTMVFDLPVQPFNSLREEEKRALMRLLGHLADGADETMPQRIAELALNTPEERLMSLVTVSAQFHPKTRNAESESHCDLT